MYLTRGMNVKTQIEQYSEDLGLSQAMTLDELIESHRRLRHINAQNHQEWLDVLRKAQEKGYRDGEAFALEHGYFSRERLRQMSVAELMEALQD